MAIHSSILVWKIPWTEEPGRLQPMGVKKESDTTEHLNNKILFTKELLEFFLSMNMCLSFDVKCLFFYGISDLADKN